MIQKQQLETSVFSQKVYLKIHSIDFCFYVSSEEVVYELYDYYPLSCFEEATSSHLLHVYWEESEKFQWTLEKNICLLKCPYNLENKFQQFIETIASQMNLKKHKVSS